MINQKYWESGETPVIVEDRRQRFRYYKEAGILEIVSLIEEDGQTKEVRRQTLPAHKLQHNREVCDLVMTFLEDSGLIKSVQTDPKP